MELLAPAGGEEQLDYAILFGADAVYLACERYGMRARACNFALADLPRIVAKAHAAGVRVHLACNVLMHHEDIAELPAFLEQADAAGVDALIVGDLGAAALARRYAPRAQLHVSTQASVTNREAAKVWHSLGARRIVAARELSLADLAALKEGMPAGMELEAFAHGAMCVAYSGRCLISDFLNGRSGLRGNCAQSCRWRYALVESWNEGRFYPIEEENGASYILNADDICMLEHLDELRQAGVDSIKIEGRNKKAYYVACVVNAYRQVLDGASPALFARELDTVSHRPYSTGFYFGPAHQTAGSIDYIRQWEWAAEVLSCADAPGLDGLYECTLRCRNRFEPSARLELLSPHCPVRPLQLGELVFLPSKEDEEPQPVDLANRTNENYHAKSSLPMRLHDIIRVER